MRVNIEYSVKAEEAKEIEMLKNDDDVSLEKLLDEIDAERTQVPDEPKEEIKNEETNERIGTEEENTILNNIKMDDEKYVTYYIHEMKETDTIDTICVKYNTQKSTLEKYNDINNLTSGDKIIIPLIDE